VCYVTLQIADTTHIVLPNGFWTKL